MSGVEVELEVATLGYWFHISAPEDNESVAAVLASGLADAKRAWRAARDAGDLGAEQKAAEEWADLVLLLGAAADGLRAQRRDDRHLRAAAGDGSVPAAGLVSQLTTWARSRRTPGRTRSRRDASRGAAASA